MKPIPVMMPAINFSAEAGKASTPRVVNAAAPMATRAKVLSPTVWPRTYRSQPIAPPSTAASTIRPNSVASCTTMSRVCPWRTTRARVDRHSLILRQVQTCRSGHDAEVRTGRTERSLRLQLRERSPARFAGRCRP